MQIEEHDEEQRDADRDAHAEQADIQAGRQLCSARSGVISC